jgi:hypothetical protein
MEVIGQNRALLNEIVGQIDTKFGELSIKLGRYNEGSALCVLLEEVSGLPFVTFSINLPEQAATLHPRQFFANTLENEHLVKPMLRSGWFKETGADVRRTLNEPVIASLWTVSYKVLFVPVPAR